MRSIASVTSAAVDLRLDARYDLDGGGARADHRDALAGQVDVVVPAGGVESRAGA
jgi:hypothetical protein